MAGSAFANAVVVACLLNNKTKKPILTPSWQSVLSRLGAFGFVCSIGWLWRPLGYKVSGLPRMRFVLSKLFRACVPAKLVRLILLPNAAYFK